jgi:MIP family channel proteins
MERPLGHRLAAEALGTFLFFFFGFSGVAVAVQNGAGAIGPFGLAAGFGIGLTLAITAFGHVSGGHFNPAVTVGVGVARRFPWRDIGPYCAAQLIGGFAAVLMIALIHGHKVTDVLDTSPGLRAEGQTVVQVEDWRALVLEFVVTALFVMVILTVATDERAAWVGTMAPLLIGFFILTAALTVGPSSGGSFNPARSLDPVLYNQDWGKIWIYLVGPLLGGAFGAGLWTALVGRREALA